MNTRKNLAAEGLVYEAPAVISLDIVSEGVLCQSGEFNLNDWTTDDEALEF